MPPGEAQLGIVGASPHSTVPEGFSCALGFLLFANLTARAATLLSQGLLLARDHPACSMKPVSGLFSVCCLFATVSCSPNRLPGLELSLATSLLGQPGVLLVSACGLLLPRGCWRVFADWGADKVCPKKLGWARCHFPMTWRSMLTAFWHH